MIDALGGVVMQSPVDEGSFRASHRVSINQQDMTFNESEKDKTAHQLLTRVKPLFLDWYLTQRSTYKRMRHTPLLLSLVNIQIQSKRLIRQKAKNT